MNTPNKLTIARMIATPIFMAVMLIEAIPYRFIIALVLFATASLTVNYLKPFPADDTVILTAQIVSAGRRIISATADAYIKSSGQMAATALATYARIPRVK